MKNLKNEKNFKGGCAGRSSSSAVADTAACLARHPEALEFGLALLHGGDDDEEGTCAGLYGTVSETGVRRGALPLLHPRSPAPIDPARFEWQFVCGVDVRLAAERKRKARDIERLMKRRQQKGKPSFDGRGKTRTLRRTDPHHEAVPVAAVPLRSVRRRTHVATLAYGVVRAVSQPYGVSEGTVVLPDGTESFLPEFRSISA